MYNNYMAKELCNVFCCSVGVKASVARTVFSAKPGCALSLWQLGGLANVSGKCGATDFLILLLYIVFVLLKVFKFEYNCFRVKGKALPVLSS